jgi:hypothetical protein
MAARGPAGLQARSGGLRKPIWPGGDEAVRTDNPMFCAHHRVAVPLKRGGQSGVELALDACTLLLGMDGNRAPAAP